MMKSGWMSLSILFSAMVVSAAPLMTPWGEKVTSATNTPGRPMEWAGKIRVPFAPESALSGVGRLIEPDEFLWYTRKIDCVKVHGERILLHCSIS